jgi:hypothetical protein
MASACISRVLFLRRALFSLASTSAARARSDGDVRSSARSPAARRLAVTGSPRLKALGAALFAAAAAASCGGGGGSTGANAALQPPSYSFAADAGVRILGGVGPVELVVGATTYMYLGGFVGPMPVKVLSTSDGVNFTPAAATLDGAPLAGGWFSFVSLPAGAFRMYYGFGPNSLPNTLYSATSHDGLTWTTEPGTRIVLNSIAVPKVTALLSGGYRVYYTTSGGPTGIASATSADGLTFTPDAGLSLSPAPSYMWGDPNVVTRGGAYLMSATQVPASNGQPTQSYSSIWLASSNDGLNWTLAAGPVVVDPAGSPVDSSFASLANGALRIYYGLFIGAAAVGGGQSEVKSGVLTPMM